MSNAEEGEEEEINKKEKSEEEESFVISERVSEWTIIILADHKRIVLWQLLGDEIHR